MKGRSSEVRGKGGKRGKDKSGGVWEEGEWVWKGGGGEWEIGKGEDEKRSKRVRG